MKTAVLALGLTCASLAVADSELSSAVASFSEDNKRLEAALGQELTAERLKEIYEISYRLQGSLSTIKAERRVFVPSSSPVTVGFTNGGTMRGGSLNILL